MSATKALVQLLERIQITEEDKQRVEALYNRAKAIPDLKINEERLPIEVVMKAYFDEKDVEVRTGTSKQNYLDLKIHNDRWYYGETYAPSSGIKTLKWKAIRLPLGLISIEVISGNDFRKQDYRFEGTENLHSTKTTYNFVCVEGENPYYQEYDDYSRTDEEELTDNQRVAMERFEESQEVSNYIKKFVDRYIYCVQKPILRSPHNRNTPFDLTNGARVSEYREKVRKLINFIEESGFYLKCMVILNEMDNAELKELEKRLETASVKLVTAMKLLNSFADKDEQFFLGTNGSDVPPKELKDSWKGNQGPVQSSIAYVEWLLTPRPETIQEIMKLKGSEINGYVSRDKEERLYPNLGELERRKNLYNVYGDVSIESEIKKLILEKKGYVKPTPSES